MSDFNNLSLSGHLTCDPDLTHIANQTALVKFGIACNRKYKDKEETCYIDCEAWGKTAENIAKFCTKGKFMILNGRLALDQWEDKQGNKKSKHKFVVQNFHFGPKTGSEAREAPAQEARTRPVDDNCPF